MWLKTWGLECKDSTVFVQIHIRYKVCWRERRVTIIPNRKKITVNHLCLPAKGLVKDCFWSELPKASLCSWLDRHVAETWKEWPGGLTLVREMTGGGVGCPGVPERRGKSILHFFKVVWERLVKFRQVKKCKLSCGCVWKTGFPFRAEVTGDVELAYCLFKQQTQ